MAPWGLILRVFAFVVFVLVAVLFAADVAKWPFVLLGAGLACWVLAEIVSGAIVHRA